MVKIAKSLASRLNGILVDQENRPISETMIISQTKSVMKMASQMDAKEIPAGSELAHRLF